MSILNSELKIYKSEVVNETTTNGGRLSSTQVVSGVSKNVFPAVSKTDRTAGLNTFRKLFAKNASADNLTLMNPQLWLDIVTAAGDAVGFFPATSQRDTFADISASLSTYDWYGCAELKENVLTGASTLTVTVEVDEFVGDYEIFKTGYKIRVTDKELPTSVSGNEEEHTILLVSYDGNDVTITLDGTTIGNDFSAANTRVMSLYEPDDIECSLEDVVVTSAGGSFDSNEFIHDNIGCIEQDWTITFTSSTSFTLYDEDMAVVATGSVSTLFAPVNADFSSPYFQIPASAFSGTFSAGNTITFTTHPAAAPLWECRIVPAGTASLSGNKTTLVFNGESE